MANMSDDELRELARKQDEMVEGYRDGFTDDRDVMPESLANRSHQYRHGWQNGRDDRRRSPRATAAELRSLAAVATAADRSGSGHGDLKLAHGRRPPPLSDARLLEILAEWFDSAYPRQDNEVQMDLRRIANRLRGLDGR